MRAQCACGGLSVDLPGPTDAVAACHCIECQRRTGAPFGAGAYYPADAVEVRGLSTRFSRQGESGAVLDFFFCPTCGSTVFWRSSRFPTRIAVALGAIADPSFPPPKTSLWERAKHPWVSIGPAQRHRDGALEDESATHVQQRE
jgi:hypothetical protein